MHFEIYDHITGSSAGAITSLNFGDLIQNQHCLKPIVFRGIIDTETSISNFKLYLENKGSWKDTEYRYYISATFQPSIEAGSSYFSNIFTEVPDATSSSPSGVDVPWSGGTSSYIWLDAQIKTPKGADEANFRVFFDPL